MNKREAFQQAKKIFPELKPTRASSFALVKDCVIIAGHDEKTSFVLHNKNDLYRLMDMCQIAINNKG